MTKDKLHDLCDKLGVPVNPKTQLCVCGSGVAIDDEIVKLALIGRVSLLTNRGLDLPHMLALALHVAEVEGFINGDDV